MPPRQHLVQCHRESCTSSAMLKSEYSLATEREVKASRCLDGLQGERKAHADFRAAVDRFALQSAVELGNEGLDKLRAQPTPA